MSDSPFDRPRTLQLLRMVESAGELRLQWDPQALLGFAYYPGDVDASDLPSREELEALVGQDLLERTFVERLTLCESCGSHAVNVHEACVSCSSSNLSQFQVFFHFRCGFTGPVSAFAQDRNGLRCPKCKKLLVDLGTDHDSPGSFFRCGSCASMFQTPHSGVRCTSCGARYTASALAGLQTIDACNYRLTNIGRAVIVQNRLLSDDEMMQADHGVERRTAFFERVERARDESLHKRESIAVLALKLPEAESAAASTAARIVREAAGDDVAVGRLDERHLAVVLDPKQAKRTTDVLSALEAAGIGAKRVRVGNGDSIPEVLEAEARGMRDG
jgi:hypothetical protein